MRPDALVTLNMRELDRLKVIQAVVELGLKPGRAAERLGLTALQVAQAIQAQRDNRRASGSPSRTNQGIEVRKPERQTGTKKRREFTQADVDGVIVELAQRRQAQPRPRKPGRRSAKAVDADVSALPVQAPSHPGRQQPTPANQSDNRQRSRRSSSHHSADLAFSSFVINTIQAV